MAGILGYSATKVFVSYLGQGLFYELKGHGVDVLSYECGETATKMTKKDKSSMSTILPSRSAEVCFRDLGTMPVTYGAFRHDFGMWISLAFPISLF